MAGSTSGASGGAARAWQRCSADSCSERERRGEDVRAGEGQEGVDQAGQDRRRKGRKDKRPWLWTPRAVLW